MRHIFIFLLLNILSCAKNIEKTEVIYKSCGEITNADICNRISQSQVSPKLNCHYNDNKCSEVIQSHGGLHRNLIWDKNWCWMDSALQILAANDEFVAVLNERKAYLAEHEWVVELSHVLNEIRDTSKNTKVDPRNLYYKIKDEKIFKYLFPEGKSGCYADNVFFFWAIYDFLFRDSKDPPFIKLGEEFQVKTSRQTLYDINIPVFFKWSVSPSWYLAEQNDPKKSKILFSKYVWFNLVGNEKDYKNHLNPWTNIESNFTTDAKTRIYSCYAMYLISKSHGTALIKINSQWRYYNDMNSDIYGVPVDDETVEKIISDNDYGGKRIKYLFYRGEIKNS